MYGNKPLMKDIIIWKGGPQNGELSGQLNIGEYLIRNIEYDHPNDCERCCRKMLAQIANRACNWPHAHCLIYVAKLCIITYVFHQVHLKYSPCT